MMLGFDDEEDGVHRESGKKCRTCGRTNCEGDPGCTMAAEARE
jgi:hypothetical protein